MTARSGHKTRGIGLFGGTLDPVHLGHLRAAEEVYENLGLDEVWFLPAFQPPHKFSKALTPFPHRIKMVELAVEDVGHFKACSMEARRPGPSYSVDTLSEVGRKLGAGHKLFFILGSDAFLEIDTWKEYYRLPLLSELVVILRSPWRMPDIEDAINRFFPGFYQDSTEQRLFVSDQGGRIRVMNVTHLEISSTDIRRRMRSGLSVRFLVPEKVRRYMITNKLYLSEKADKKETPSGALMSSVEMAEKIFEEIRNNKAEDISVLDMRGISPIADFFIIAHGRSTRHVQGMASKMRRQLSRLKIRCLGVEGEDEGKWVLLDFDDIVVHLFYEPVRSFYDLEGLWSEAPRLSFGRPEHEAREKTNAR